MSWASDFDGGKWDLWTLSRNKAGETVTFPYRSWTCNVPHTHKLQPWYTTVIVLYTETIASWWSLGVAPMSADNDVRGHVVCQCRCGWLLPSGYETISITATQGLVLDTRYHARHWHHLSQWRFLYPSLCWFLLWPCFCGQAEKIWLNWK